MAIFKLSTAKSFCKLEWKRKDGSRGGGEIRLVKGEEVEEKTEAAGGKRNMRIKTLKGSTD